METKSAKRKSSGQRTGTARETKQAKPSRKKPSGATAFAVDADFLSLSASAPLPAPADILIWEDDPESQDAVPVAAPVPGDPQSRFQINIIAVAPEPKRYPPGTPEFRYWNARSALVRCRDFWEPLLPSDAVWQTGAQLPVTLEAGVQLNAYYNRPDGLRFHYDHQDGRDIYTAESADVVCHEMGHAILVHRRRIRATPVPSETARLAQ